MTNHHHHQDTVPTAVDYKGRLAVRSKHGRWVSSFFIIWVEMAERLSFVGISANLITYLTEKLGQSTTMAAANLNAWSGVAMILPILGAVIADSFLGKFYTIIASCFIYILGLGLLALSASLPSLNCHNQGESIEDNTSECSHQHLRVIIFFVALYMVAVGQGGHKPCVQAFGADQFDGDDPHESKAKSSFFNWWYFAVCLGGLLGIAVLSYVQENLSWGLGFAIPSIIMIFSIVMFLLGTMTYRYSLNKKEDKGPFSRIGRIFFMAVKNWNVDNHEEKANDIEGIDNVGSKQFRFLDKALLLPMHSNINDKACSMSDVDEAKAILRLFPIWATNLIFAIVFSQPGTFFTKQGLTLDRSIGSKFAIPAAALMCFTAICVMIFIPIYDFVIVPYARKLTGNQTGISMLQRIGIGLFLSIITMIVAVVIEKKRLETASRYGLIDSPDVTIPMSIWWLLPQYALFGIAEAFTIVGLQEFFYSQVPNELRSVGLSLNLSIFGLGGLLSGVLVSVINKASSRIRGESWFSNNLNRAHLDYFYMLLAGLSVLALVLFVYSARSYIYNRTKAHL